MAVLPYKLLRPLLFCMRPESAHDFTLKMLEKWQNTPMQALFFAKKVADPITLAGLKFPNRVGLAAGLDKNARCIDGLAAMGFGSIEVGTVTPKAQAGNLKPRMFRLEKNHALINRMGFNNDGLDCFIRNVQDSRLRRQSSEKIILGLNIGKNSATPIEDAIQDYLIGLDGVYPWADYVSINISSPNTKNLRTLQQQSTLSALLDALLEKREELIKTHEVYKPIFLKIAPDLDVFQINDIADLLKVYNMDGVIATNTTLSREAVTGHLHANEVGGLSGDPLRQSSNTVIRILRERLGKNFPIIGVGGIRSGNDAWEKIQAGADIIQIYTGFVYQGPGLIGEVAKFLKKKMTWVDS
jgi:dihydroorotate dehydrogenase